MLIGENPSKYSLSPRLWNAALLDLEIDAEYLALDVRAKHLKKTLDILVQDPSILGFNVTNPYKESVAKYPGLQLQGDSNILEAVNTFIKKKDHLEGYSTDGYGAIQSLFESFSANALKEKEILVLGAGGSGRAIALACSRHGNVSIANRTLDKAKSLAEKIKITPLNLYSSNFFEVLENSDVVINTLPIEKDYDQPILKVIPGKPKICLDIVYGHKSYFLKKAKEEGHSTLDGKSMLLHQALRSFDYFFGLDASLPMKKEIAKISN